MFFHKYLPKFKVLVLPKLSTNEVHNRERDEERMKKMKRYAALVAVSALALSPVAPAKAEDDALKTSPLTEVLNLPRAEFDNNLGDYDVFTAVFMDTWGMLPESSLKVLADGNTALTAFVPTDRAFRKLVRYLTGKAPKSEEAITNAVLSLGSATLEKVLLYHVVVGNPILSADALNANGATLSSANAQTFKVNVVGSKITLVDKASKHTNAVVLLSKIDINNGNKQVAHGINQVMLPKLS
jgi:uncharacterized surface protein with fasciclin (FAS1) repeats